mgnify:CR=1 FL=1
MLEFYIFSFYFKFDFLPSVLGLYFGSILRFGYRILGSIVETKWVNQGDLVEIEIEKLGKASINFV